MKMEKCHRTTNSGRVSKSCWIDRAFGMELLVLVPVLMLATDRLSRHGWSGEAQSLLFYGTILAMLALTTVLVFAFWRPLERRTLRSPRLAKLADGRGWCGFVAIPGLLVFVLCTFASHPAHVKVLGRVLGIID